jgi:hypothetical protein
MPLPEISDDGGYRVTAGDLRFLGLSQEQVLEWAEKRVPLGLSKITFDALQDGLWDALDADNIDPNRVDVRIRGSSVEFFAGKHKRLPWTRSDIEEAIRTHRGRACVRKTYLTEHAQHLLYGQWSAERAPNRRPFDVMFVIGIARHRSDIDIQLCSDDIFERCRYYSSLDPNPQFRYVSFDGKYNYIDEEYVRPAMPHLTEYALELSKDLNRDVNPVVFEGNGPPDAAETEQGWQVQLKRRRA